MNNLSDEYYSTTRKAGQLLKTMDCQPSIFQLMALSVCKGISHFPPSRGFPVNFSWVWCRGCSSKQPERFTRALLLHPLLGVPLAGAPFCFTLKLQHFLFLPVSLQEWGPLGCPKLLM